MSSVLRWVVATLAAFCVVNMIFFLMLLEEKSQSSLLSERLDSISRDVQASRQRIVSDIVKEVGKAVGKPIVSDGDEEEPANDDSEVQVASGPLSIF